MLLEFQGKPLDVKGRWRNADPSSGIDTAYFEVDFIEYKGIDVTEALNVIGVMEEIEQTIEDI